MRSDEHLELRRPEQVLLALHRRVGRVGVVAAVTAVSVVISVALTSLLVIPLLTEEDTRNGMLEVSLGIAVVVPAAVAPLVTLLLTSLILRLDEAYHQMWTLSTRDPLTHAFNRRGLFSEAERRIARADGRQVLVGMVDLNDFKRINDTHGHTSGDEVLLSAATALSSLISKAGTIGRIGGDEFAFIAAGTAAEVEHLSEQVRTFCAGFRVAIPSGHVLVSADAGLATVAPGESFADALARADRALCGPTVAVR